MVEGRKLGVCGLVGLAVGGLVGGCNPTAVRNINSLGRVALGQAVVSGVRNEVEGARGGVVNVGDVDYSAKHIERKLAIHYWKDFDGDGEFGDGELFNDIGDSVNMSNMGIVAYLGDTDLILANYVILDSNDKIVLKEGPTLGIKICEGHLPLGKYTITVQSDGFMKTRGFEVMR